MPRKAIMERKIAAMNAPEKMVTIGAKEYQSLKDMASLANLTKSQRACKAGNLSIAGWFVTEMEAVDGYTVATSETDILILTAHGCISMNRKTLRTICAELQAINAHAPERFAI